VFGALGTLHFAVVFVSPLLVDRQLRSDFLSTVLGTCDTILSVFLSRAQYYLETFNNIINNCKLAQNNIPSNVLKCESYENVRILYVCVCVRACACACG
jgi:hypothetical protein